MPLERDDDERDVDRRDVDRDDERPELDRDDDERPEPERDDDERPEPERDDVRERDERERDDELDERERDDERRRVDVRRSAAGISAVATALVSCGICLRRKSRMRSSSRRIDFAIFAVSRSPTDSASASIAVYVAISSASSWNSVLAFLSIFSCSPVPRSACNGPCASAAARLATFCTASPTASGPGMLAPSADAPSCLMRRSSCRA